MGNGEHPELTHRAHVVSLTSGSYLGGMSLAHRRSPPAPLPLHQENLIACNETANGARRFRGMSRLQLILCIDLVLWLLIAVAIKTAFG